MSVRRRRRIGLIWVAVTTLLVGVAATIGALGGNTERVTRMWVSATIGEDGSARITEVIDYDFGAGLEPRHGIYRDVPGLPFGDEEAKVHVSVDSAPVPYDLTGTDDWGPDANRIRIGDPGGEVSGVHRYRIQYTLPEAVRHGKLAWDAVGTGWKVELDNVEIHVLTPYDLTGTRCVHGTTGSQQRCDVTEPEPGHLAVHLGSLGPGRGATLYASRAGDAGDAKAPAPAPPSGPATASDVVDAWVPGALAAAIALATGLATLWLLRLAGRERIAADGQEKRVDVEKLKRYVTPVSSPPEGLTPAQGGVLLTERPLPQHQVAWLMTAALDGYLDIDDNQHHPTLTRRTPADGTKGDPVVKDVLDHVFPGRDSVTLGAYDPWFRTGWISIGGHLEVWRRDCGLWDPARVSQSLWTRLFGGVAALPATIAVIVGSVFSDNGAGSAWLVVLLAGAVVAGAGLAAAIRGWELEVRTARGTALWLQVQSFRRYLTESAPHQVDEAADAGHLDRYTAWAMALGEIDRWNQAVTGWTATLAAPRSARHPQRMSLFEPALAVSLIAATAASERAPSSSGSTGSGGGSGGGVGGGVGGGGGGSW
ncbi:DUF2207 domain-containing protein [Streptomyces sp. NPDC001020]